jgi:hypothetical protein
MKNDGNAKDTNHRWIVRFAENFRYFPRKSFVGKTISMSYKYTRKVIA